MNFSLFAARMAGELIDTIRGLESHLSKLPLHGFSVFSGVGANYSSSAYLFARESDMRSARALFVAEEAAMIGKDHFDANFPRVSHLVVNVGYDGAFSFIRDAIPEKSFEGHNPGYGIDFFSEEGRLRYPELSGWNALHQEYPVFHGLRLLWSGMEDDAIYINAELCRRKGRQVDASHSDLILGFGISGGNRIFRTRRNDGRKIPLSLSQGSSATETIDAITGYLTRLGKKRQGH